MYLDRSLRSIASFPSGVFRFLSLPLLPLLLFACELLLSARAVAAIILLSPLGGFTPSASGCLLASSVTTRASSLGGNGDFFSTSADDVDSVKEIRSTFDEVDDEDVHDCEWWAGIWELFAATTVLLLVLLADGSVDDKAIFSSLRFRSSDCDNFIVGRSRKLYGICDIRSDSVDSE